MYIGNAHGIGLSNKCRWDAHASSKTAMLLLPRAIACMMA
jgi:hypothetical protein